MNKISEITAILAEVANHYKDMDEDDKEVVRDLLEFTSDNSSWDDMDYMNKEEIVAEFERRLEDFIQNREDEREELADDEDCDDDEDCEDSGEPLDIEALNKLVEEHQNTTA